MGEEGDYLKVNKDSWNARVDYHLRSEFYDVPGFIAGRSSLDPISQEALGNIEEKSVLHLQCHFGMDTLSMARMGGLCTGIDLSDKAIAAAKELNAQLGTAVNFVETDVYSVKEHIAGQFDIVFSTYGTIGWLPDLDRWADVVRAKLKPKGKLILIEFHPFIWMYDDQLKQVTYPYFNKSAIIEEMNGTYAAKDAVFTGREISWNHPISEVQSALLNAGLTLERFSEYDHSPYEIFKGMTKLADWSYVTPQHKHLIPYVYALECTKPT